jgi:predicted metal-dependent hydrolase
VLPDPASILQARLSRRVELEYSRARTAPLQVEQGPLRVRIRAHRFFTEAPPEVWEDVASWIRAGKRARRACERLDAWIDARLAELPRKERRKAKLQPKGAVHDLDLLATGLFAREFQLDFEGGRVRPDITWGRRGRRKARRSLLLGSYQPATNIVRVHPVLDQTFVPDWFVRFVLFHEILHAVIPSDCGRHHGPQFRARERDHPDYERVVRWEKSQVHKLLRTARSGAADKAPQRTLFPFF